jgi:hypothetical protein
MRQGDRHCGQRAAALLHGNICLPVPFPSTSVLLFSQLLFMTFRAFSGSVLRSPLPSLLSGGGWVGVRTTGALPVNTVFTVLPAQSPFMLRWRWRGICRLPTDAAMPGRFCTSCALTPYCRWVGCTRFSSCLLIRTAVDIAGLWAA